MNLVTKFSLFQPLFTANCSLVCSLFCLAIAKANRLNCWINPNALGEGEDVHNHLVAIGLGALCGDRIALLHSLLPLQILQSTNLRPASCVGRSVSPFLLISPSRRCFFLLLSFGECLRRLHHNFSALCFVSSRLYLPIESGSSNEKKNRKKPLIPLLISSSFLIPLSFVPHI